MKYFRRATLEDFITDRDEWDKSFPPEVQALMRSEQYAQAVNQISKLGMGLAKAKSIVEDYKKFTQALQDYKNGEDVFIEY